MKTIVATLASALLIGGAYAEAPTSESKEKMSVENHIKEVHGELQITAAEETQWDAVATAMRDGAEQTDKAIDKRKVLGDSATAVESLNAYAEIAQAHADGVKKLGSAFGSLYASMPVDQKKVADAVFAHRPHKGKKAAT